MKSIVINIMKISTILGGMFLIIVITYCSNDKDTLTDPDDSTNKLIVYYPFNGNANDESGNGNHGVIYGATLATDKLGNENCALSFDGNDDYVEISSSLIFSEITFSAWVKIGDVYINNKRIFTIDDGEDSVYYYFDIEGTSLNTLAVNVGGVGIMDYDWPLISNSWTHIAVTYDGNNVRIYKDGVLIEKGVISASPRTGLLYIGGVDNPNYSAQTWDGIIDEVCIYNYQLSESEIQILYQNGFTL